MVLKNHFNQTCRAIVSAPLAALSPFALSRSAPSLRSVSVQRGFGLFQPPASSVQPLEPARHCLPSRNQRNSMKTNGDVQIYSTLIRGFRAPLSPLAEEPNSCA